MGTGGQGSIYQQIPDPAQYSCIFNYTACWTKRQEEKEEEEKEDEEEENGGS